MNKKCIICDDKAQYAIKNTKDYYCKDCASEQFGDLSYLVSVEDALKSQKEPSTPLDQLEEEMTKENFE